MIRLARGAGPGCTGLAGTHRPAWSGAISGRKALVGSFLGYKDGADGNFSDLLRRGLAVGKAAT